MKAAEILFAAELSRILEISEDEIFELARTKQLPFAISSAHPRRLCISKSDLGAWKNAARELAQE
jgi:hypothetical protein